MQILKGTGTGLQAQPGTRKHFYQFYKGKEDFFRTAIPFLWVGLRNKEACLWIVSRSIGVLTAIETFQRQYDLIPYIEHHQFLILLAEEWYLESGRFSEDKIFQRSRRFMEEKNHLGFKSFRCVGDAGWIEPQHWHEFQAYEKKTHETLGNLSVTTLCAYPIGKCSVTQTRDIVEHHDGVFLTKL